MINDEQNPGGETSSDTETKEKGGTANGTETSGTATDPETSGTVNDTETSGTANDTETKDNSGKANGTEMKGGESKRRTKRNKTTCKPRLNTINLSSILPLLYDAPPTGSNNISSAKLRPCSAEQ